MNPPPQLTIQQLHDVRAQGARLQFLAPSGWRDTDNAPDGNDDPERWRVKPGPVPPALEDEEESGQAFGAYANTRRSLEEFSAWDIWEASRKRAIELCKAHHSNEP